MKTAVIIRTRSIVIAGHGLNRFLSRQSLPRLKKRGACRKELRNSTMKVRSTALLPHLYRLAMIHGSIFQIAIEGCCHGELDAIYKHIEKLEEKNKYKVDLLLICGDFQAIRNHQDLQCMAVPQKYKQLGQFNK